MNHRQCKGTQSPCKKFNDEQASSSIQGLGHSELVSVEGFVVQHNLGVNYVLGVPGVLDGETYGEKSKVN